MLNYKYGERIGRDVWSERCRVNDLVKDKLIHAKKIKRNSLHAST